MVVSDTSAITNLASVGRLDVLERLFHGLWVPPAVAFELVAHGIDAVGAVDVRAVRWMHLGELSDTAAVAPLLREIDVGEAEAIILALQMQADLILLDDRRARQCAVRLGVCPMGLLGALLLGKQRGVLDAVRPVLDALISSAGFYVDSDLYKYVLESALEA